MTLAKDMAAHFRRYPFGETPEGQVVEAIALTSDKGLSVTVLTLGAALQSIRVADGTEVLLGLASVKAYLAQNVYLGATVGRYANRIRDGRYVAGGVETKLVTQDGGHCLHGGARGFDRAHWQVASVGFAADGAPEATLAHVSLDGDQGFPGELTVEARFSLRGHRLDMGYRATTTRLTPISLTSHGYFNLAGAGVGDVAGHVLSLAADRYLPVDADLIPEGAPSPVDGGVFDFRKARPLADGLASTDPQILRAGGYDHCFALSAPGDMTRPAAQLFEPVSGRRMSVFTTEPGLQLFTGHVLDGSLIGPDGRVFGPRSGLCLETQAFPDSPNRPDFPSCWLFPGETFESKTRLLFD
jgi:aldose 1-epimerase